MSQYEKLKQRVIEQANKVFKNFKTKPTSYKEVTNHDITLLLASYSVFKPTSYSQDKLEDLHERLCRLSKKEMEIINRFYWQGKTQEEIAADMNMSQQWVAWKLKKIYEKMR